MRTRGKSGFTLIEWMIIVVIIGILAALAIPRFMRATTKSKQSEAKQILKQIYVMEQAFRQEYDAYFPNKTNAKQWCRDNGSGGCITDTASASSPNVFGSIGIEISLNARYKYVIEAYTNTFTATATSSILDDDPTPDTWTINENGVLTCTSDDATQ